MPEHELVIETEAVLFDMDGVLVDSRAVVERAWRRWAADHGLDADAILAVAHGRRTRDTLAEVAPHLNALDESVRLDALEAHDVDGLMPMAGAAQLLRALPDHLWAVVTSAHREMAIDRLNFCGLPLPRHLVTSELVARGKPDPEGYLAGARRIGVDPRACLVFEDAPPGIAAGRAAGMRVIALATTHATDRLRDATAIIPDLSAVTVQQVGERLRMAVPTQR